MTLTNQEIARLDEVLKTSTEFAIDKELSETALQILTEKICKDIACSEHQFSFKDLSQDKKITMFKVLLEQATCYNKQLLVNLVNLLKAYNQFSDDFFKNSVIVFANIPGGSASNLFTNTLLIYISTSILVGRVYKLSMN